MKVFIIQKYDLREQHGLSVIFFALSLAAHIQHADGRLLSKTSGADPCGDRDERIIATARCHGIKLIFPSLEALLKITHHVTSGFLFRFGTVYAQRQILIDILLIGFLRIRL